MRRRHDRHVYRRRVRRRHDRRVYRRRVRHHHDRRVYRRRERRRHDRRVYRRRERRHHDRHALRRRERRHRDRHVYHRHVRAHHHDGRHASLRWQVRSQDLCQLPCSWCLQMKTSRKVHSAEPVHCQPWLVVRRCPVRVQNRPDCSMVYPAQGKQCRHRGQYSLKRRHVHGCRGHALFARQQ